MSTSIREIGENIKNAPQFAGTVSFDRPLSPLTTMQTGGSAAVFVEPASTAAARAALQVALQAGVVPCTVLGGGSNVIAPDAGIDGIVLSSRGLTSLAVRTGRAAPCTLDDWDAVQESCPVTLFCGSGVQVDFLADWCARHGILGMQQFAGLPGTVGGAAWMNARCYEQNFSDLIATVEYLDLNASPAATADGPAAATYIKLDNRDWDYKKSPFQSQNCFITGVRLMCTCIDVHSTGGSASPAVQDYIRTKNEHYREDRRQKGHFRAPSAGSAFKNDRRFGKPSGKLIEEAGLKGRSVGGAQVAPWHGNFIINTGGATSADIRALVSLVQDEVQASSGCQLEPEIIFL